MPAILLIVILAIVEGMTEFIPVSSTAHMILVEEFFGRGVLSKSFMNNFLIVVQLGAILAVVVYFWKDVTPFVKTKDDFLQRFRLWLKVIVGVLPAAVIGFFLDDIVEKYFFDNILVIAITLIFYGIIFIIVERKYKRKNNSRAIATFKKLKYRTAFYIGFFQCLAMIPGTSRSGATIIGALLLGLSRPLAAEFSFYLAIPTMLGATFLKVMKNGLSFTSKEWLYIGIGTFIAFIVALVIIKWFMEFIKEKDFIFFGIYRIILGIVLLTYMIYAFYTFIKV